MELESHKHFKLYKPYGYLSQFVTNDIKPYKKKLLSQLFSLPEGIMPIGRLDEKSEGLLLLTTNGKLSDTINRSGIEKEYYVQLDGIITSEAVSKMEKGVEIGFSGKKYITKPCSVYHIDTPHFPERSKKLRDDRHGPTCWISICLTEGKFRQIRKMTAAVGYPTLRLVRVRIGSVLLDDMKVGEIVALAESEII